MFLFVFILFVKKEDNNEYYTDIQRYTRPCFLPFDFQILVRLVGYSHVYLSVLQCLDKTAIHSRFRY